MAELNTQVKGYWFFIQLLRNTHMWHFPSTVAFYVAW